MLKCASGALNLFDIERGVWISNLGQYSQPLQSRRQFAKQLDPLSSRIRSLA